MSALGPNTTALDTSDIGQLTSESPLYFHTGNSSPTRPGTQGQKGLSSAHAGVPVLLEVRQVA